MHELACTHCGRPIALSIESPWTHRCTACGRQGDHPPAVRAQLVQTVALLRQLDAQALQIPERLSHSFLGHEAVFFAVWQAVAALGGMFGVLILVRKVDDGALPVAQHLATLTAVLVASVAPFLWARRLRRRFQDAFAAAPPLVPGAQARCHVCGAELPPRQLSAGGVTRCRHCAADNLVDAKIVANVGRRQRLALDARVASIPPTTRWYGWVSWVLGGSILLLAPGAGILTHHAFLAVAVAIDEASADERQFDPTQRYVTLDCYVRAVDASGGVEGVPARENGRPPRVTQQSTFTAPMLLTMTFSLRPGTGASKVVRPRRVYRDDAGIQTLLFFDKYGFPVRRPVVGRCAYDRGQSPEARIVE